MDQPAVLATLAGRVTLSAGGSTLDERRLPGRQGKLVLAYLVAERRPVPRDELAEVLWPAGPPPTWERTLSAVVSRLRLALAGIGLPSSALSFAAGCYELRPAVRTDLGEAADALALAERCAAGGDRAAAIEAAARAAEIFRTPFLPGEDGDWPDRVRSASKGSLLRALTRIADAALGAPSAVEAGTEAVALDPYNEAASRSLMRAHAAVGERAAAVLVFERLRDLLAGDLGVDPSPETVAASEEILRAGVGGGPAPVPISTASGGAPALGNLPLRTTSFIGRTRQLDEIADLLRRRRLVTLLGPAGAGKSRLAQEVADKVRFGFAGGGWWTDLAPAADTAAAVRSLASAVGVRDESGRSPLDSVAARIGDTSTLVVLDNCEHLLGAVRAIGETLLNRCAGVTLLATSRAPIGLADEDRYDVPPLETRGDAPADLARAEAVELFVDRAMAILPTLQPTVPELEAIARICRRLDGLPLAIELAASRMGVLGVHDIEERLDARLDLLRTRGPQGRHDALRASLDWSHALLQEEERILLSRLAVFAGTFGLDGVEAVCAGEGIAKTGVLDLLARLVEQSLVAVEQEGGRARYRLLETIRVYAAERLAERGDEAARRERHLRWCLAVGEEHSRTYRRDKRAGVAGVGREYDNLRAALDWASDGGDPVAGLTLATLLVGYWMTAGRWSEGLDQLVRLHERAGDIAGMELRADALFGVSVLRSCLRDFAPAVAAADEALAIQRGYDDWWKLCRCLIQAMNVASATGDRVRARAMAEECVALARSKGDADVLSYPVNELGKMAALEGDFDQAEARFSECLELARQAGERAQMAVALHNLGHLAFVQGNLARARALLEEALAIRRESREPATIASSTFSLGAVALAEGNHREAAVRLGDAARRRAELGDWGGVAACLQAIGKLAAEEGRLELAARLVAASLATREATGEAASALDEEDRAGTIRTVRAGLAEPAFDAAWERGSAMPLERALADAIEVAAAIGAEPAPARG